MYIQKEEIVRIIAEDVNRVEKISVLEDRCNVKVQGGDTTAFFCSLKHEEGKNTCRAMIADVISRHTGDFVVYNRRTDGLLVDMAVTDRTKILFSDGEIKAQFRIGGGKAPAPAKIIKVEELEERAKTDIPAASREAILEYHGVRIATDNRQWPEKIAELIPAMDPNYEEDIPTVKKALACLANGMPLMLGGHTGVGKTKLVEHLAALLNKPLIKIQGAEDMETATMLGHLEIDPQGTYWVDGLITTAAKQGFMLYFDEINAAPAGVKIALHGLLDDQRVVVLADHHGERISAHPMFLFVAACNPADHGAYIGAGQENLAFINRFVQIRMGYMDAKIEERLLKRLYPQTDKDAIANLVKSANMVRGLFLNEEIMAVVSTRDLKNICANMAFLTADEALSIIFSRFQKDDAKRAIDCFEQNFGILTECQKLIS